jgi:hypothetical protein
LYPDLEAGKETIKNPASESLDSFSQTMNAVSETLLYDWVKALTLRYQKAKADIIKG